MSFAIESHLFHPCVAASILLDPSSFRFLKKFLIPRVPADALLIRDGHLMVRTGRLMVLDGKVNGVISWALAAPVGRGHVKSEPNPRGRDQTGSGLIKLDQV